MPFRIRVTLILLAALAAAALLLPLVWPIPPLEGTVPAREAAGPDATWIEVDGVDLHARVAGPPADPGAVGVVFVHGFGSTLVSFASQQDALAGTVRSVAYDRPAFGLTERVTSWDGANPYAPEAQVRHVRAAMDAAGLTRAVVVGHSAGGAIALEAALAYPDRVAGLVLIAPAVYRGGGAPAASRWLLRTPQLERIGPALMRQLGGPRGESLLRAAYADPDRLPPEVLAAYRASVGVDAYDAALWELVKASRATDVGEQLDAVRVPAQVVTGDADPVVPPEETRRVADALPNAILTEIPGCGHAPQEACPAPVLDAVRAALAAAAGR